MSRTTCLAPSSGFQVVDNGAPRTTVLLNTDKGFRRGSDLENPDENGQHASFELCPSA